MREGSVVMGNVRYMNSEMAAEYLGLGTGAKGANLLRQMVHKRQVGFIKLGSRLRFDRVELDKWMAEHKVNPECAL